ncbi:MAG: hypothetical protein U5R31_10685 [Acidimicrobiia bacterium]|nr:hypothetical protein [Acidimicrobiia bacterium]
MDGPEEDLDHDEYGLRRPVLEKATMTLTTTQGAVRVLRWAAAAALVLWALNLILTASLAWESTASMSGPVITPTPSVPGVVEPATMGFFERIRMVLVASIESGGLLLITAAVAYGFSGLVQAWRPGRGAGDPGTSTEQ